MKLVTTPKYKVSHAHVELVKKALDYKQASLSPNTWRTYLSMWKKFRTWCEVQGVSHLPAKSETIALYLAAIGKDVSFSTLDTSIAAIEKAHKERGVEILGDTKIYHDVRKGIRKIHKEKLKIRQAPALSIVDLKIALKGLTNGMQDIRDRALITLGYWGAFRRGELSAITYDNVTFTEVGLIIFLLGSKTSDTLEEVYISKTQDPLICPVKALKDWLLISGIQEGPIFRSLLKGGKISENQLSGHSVSHIMKRLFGKTYSGHSLRRGIITETAIKGVPVHEIQKFSRHKSVDMVLRYAEKAKGFESTTGKVLRV